MLSVQASTWIQADPQTVFDYLDVPERQPGFTPSLVESRLVERLPNGGSRAKYRFRILGLDFEGEVRATNYLPPRDGDDGAGRIVWAMNGDLRGSIRWYVTPDDGGTHFTYAATYAVPGPALLRSLTTPLVQRYNEREVDTLLSRLKTQVENWRR